MRLRCDIGQFEKLSLMFLFLLQGLAMCKMLTFMRPWASGSGEVKLYMKLSVLPTLANLYTSHI